MFKYMDRFGFDAKPRLDYPSFQLAASGVYDGNTLLDARATRSTSARVAIGQERLRVTPLQMAEVAADGRQQGGADGAAAVVEGDRPGRPRDQARPRRARAG